MVIPQAQILRLLMKAQYEHKSYTAEIKDLDLKNRIVTGYLSAWTKDFHDDIITPGAYAKTLKERSSQILFLNQHNWQMPHGYFKELFEDAHGLGFVSNPLPNTSYSNDALELYAQGIMKEHSIGFEAVKWKWDEENKTREINEIKLYEGSNVTLGANSDTPFTGFKTLTVQELNDMSTRIIKTLRDGTMTDDGFRSLEIALKQLQKEAYTRGKLDASNQPGPGPTNPQQIDFAQAIKQFTQTLN